MRLASTILASLVALASLASVAAAEPEPLAVGFRVGGYGFHRENAGTWDECRMNGAGVFAQHAVKGPLYLEAGLDAYSTVGGAPATDLQIDRQSALVSVAAGARTNVTPWLTGYVQVGAGAELARLAVPYGDGSTIRDSKVMPAGFFGVGADLRIARGTFLGATLRTLVMGNFDYEPARLQMANPWVAAPAASDVFAASPSLAAQGQFYLRHDL
ncbi:MAG: outer membrane beta-barrel protein [Acidobacteriota bacterium]